MTMPSCLQYVYICFGRQHIWVKYTGYRYLDNWLIVMVTLHYVLLQQLIEKKLPFNIFVAGQCNICMHSYWPAIWNNRQMLAARARAHITKPMHARAPPSSFPICCKQLDPSTLHPSINVFLIVEQTYLSSVIVPYRSWRTAPQLAITQVIVSTYIQLGNRFCHPWVFLNILGRAYNQISWYFVVRASYEDNFEKRNICLCF